MNALDDITREDILEAIDDVRREGLPARRGATRSCLVHDGGHWPPRVVLGVAASRARGRGLATDDLLAGPQADDRLGALGFTVRACTCGGAAEPVAPTRPSLRVPSEAAPRARLHRTPPPIAVHPALSSPMRLPTRLRPAGPATVARLVFSGPPPRAESMLEQVLLDLAGRAWPSAERATFVQAPGGFVELAWPRAIAARPGWDAGGDDLAPLFEHASRELATIVTTRVLRLLQERADVLTLGVDVGGDDGHAELLAVYDLARGALVRWSGTSFPTLDEEDALVQVGDLRSHLLEIAGERVLLLGGDDLTMWSPRGRASQNPAGRRRRRCDAMRALAERHAPTVVLHHPHGTDTPRIWSSPWRELRKELPSVATWSSAITWFNAWGNRERAPLEETRAKSASGAVHDAVLDPAKYD